MINNYYNKYIKYKIKYLNLIYGGTLSDRETVIDPTQYVTINLDNYTGFDFCRFSNKLVQILDYIKINLFYYFISKFNIKCTDLLSNLKLPQSENPNLKLLQLVNSNLKLLQSENPNLNLQSVNSNFDLIITTIINTNTNITLIFSIDTYIFYVTITNDGFQIFKINDNKIHKNFNLCTEFKQSKHNPLSNTFLEMLTLNVTGLTITSNKPDENIGLVKKLLLISDFIFCLANIKNYGFTDIAEAEGYVLKYYRLLIGNDLDNISIYRKKNKKKYKIELENYVNILYYVYILYEKYKRLTIKNVIDDITIIYEFLLSLLKLEFNNDHDTDLKNIFIYQQNVLFILEFIPTVLYTIINIDLCNKNIIYTINIPEHTPYNISDFFILLAKSTVVYPNELEEILNELDKINTKLEAYIADETQITFCELMKRFSNDSENKQFLETNSKCNLYIYNLLKLRPTEI